MLFGSTFDGAGFDAAGALADRVRGDGGEECIQEPGTLGLVAEGGDQSVGANGLHRGCETQRAW